MGLDQYAYSRKYSKNGKKHTDSEIAYWRKHNRLQGWMENLWEERGEGGTFNCKELILTLEDLDELEKAINDRTLPETVGFFYGTDSYEQYEEWYKEDDTAFIDQARDLLNKGHDIYYTCWW